MLTPRSVSTGSLVGARSTRNQGIIGEGVDLTLIDSARVRDNTVLFHLTKHLLETGYRDADEDPKLHLFGQLKAIVREWLDHHLDCEPGTYRAQLLFPVLADMACKRIKDGILEAHQGNGTVKAVLDPYNPAGSTRDVSFTTSKSIRWQTDPRRSHVNWAVCDSEWEAQFCRIVEGHPRVRAYVKNQNLGLEVPYRYGATARTYIPDFVLLVDDGRGDDDLLNLIVEIKGYRGEDAKDKKATMDTYWIPGVNHLQTSGRWAFRELTSIQTMEMDFDGALRQAVERTLDSVLDV